VAHIWIEMDRGDGWELHQEGEADITAEQLRQRLPTYCSRYKARAFLNGFLIGEAFPICGELASDRTHGISGSSMIDNPTQVDRLMAKLQAHASVVIDAGVPNAGTALPNQSAETLTG
jgi:hypothetical protein